MTQEVRTLWYLLMICLMNDTHCTGRGRVATMRRERVGRWSDGAKHKARSEKREARSEKYAMGCGKRATLSICEW